MTDSLREALKALEPLAPKPSGAIAGFRVGQKVKYVGGFTKWYGKELTVYALGVKTILVGPNQNSCTMADANEVETMEKED